MPENLDRPGLLASALLLAVRGYQVAISPLVAGSCRYMPSCSQYMAEAIRRHGAARGGWLGLRRLARCHPLGSSGFDPVPDTWKTTPGVISRTHQTTPGAISREQSGERTPGAIRERGL